MTFVYILLFIIFLSILIVVHELGHLIFAKIFNVYCFEFSIGFGPAIIHRKKEKAETYFSLRVIPFGGYVSMYGEAATVPDGITVDPSRSLENIKKWKKAIILVAGVTMNAVLAIVMFFISEQACPQYAVTLNYATFTNDSIVLNSGINPDEAIYLRGIRDADGRTTNYAYLDGAKPKSTSEEIIPSAIVTFSDGSQKDVSICIDQSKFTYNDVSYNNALAVFQNYDYKKTSTVDGKTVEEMWRYPDVSKKIKFDNVTSLTFTICNCKYDTSEGTLNALDETRVRSRSIELMSQKGNVKNLGMSMYKEKYYNNYQGHYDKNGFYDDRNAFRKTFVDFGNSATLIFRGLASLFSPNGWKNVGGIVAIGVTTSQTLANFGIGKFLFYWGMISVNLAIVNLFPFPGLDGWHLLVTLIEGITKKKVPQKFKTAAAAIGIAILFVLMIAIIVKDIIFYV